MEYLRNQSLPPAHAWIAQWKSFLVVRDVELQIFGQRLVSLRPSYFQRLLRNCDSFVELTRFGVGGASRAQDRGIIAPGMGKDVLRQLNGARAIAQRRIRASGQDPGKVALRVKAIGFELQASFPMFDCLE